MTATLTVNKSIFKENIKQVTRGAAVMAVVKNNAYNFGLDFAVNTFLEEGIQTFSTTSLHEAIQIRRLAPTSMIFLMNPSVEFETLREYDIQMTLPSLSFYHQYQNELAGINVHLEYENLLHRSGFKTFEEMKQVIQENSQLPKERKLNITGIWTHFGYADEFDVTEYEQEKQAWLLGLQEMIGIHSFQYIHAQNSASFMRDDLFEQHTHARLGIVLYGCRPYSSLPETAVKQSLTLSATVIQCRNLKQGESAGYSFAYTAKTDTTVAVVDIGYGDGVLRTRSQHDCLINGKRYPIRALMMSHLLVEVDQAVKPQDSVILYGEDIRIDEYTFKGVGANSEQISALNHCSLERKMIE
ncbi:alanine racemase [Vagococcus bubulae]|uniref:alanine racemase n=1 Tax=Vagococcus bubulae TaxID=1977868 RepID=UPI0022E153BF|nr:alanine racemase [Vagococcus bubulae]